MSEPLSTQQQLALAAQFAAEGADYLRRSDVQAAEAALRKAIAYAPQQAGNWSNLSAALHGLGRAAEAEASSRQALALDPHAAGHWVNLGNALYAQRQWEAAVVAYREALNRDPADPLTWSNLGAALQRLENLSAAQAVYERSLALAPGHPDAVINFAYLLAQRGQPQEAIDRIRQRLTELAELPGAWVALGYAYKQVGDLAQAESSYQRALALSPQHREARYRLALVRQSQWRLTEAEAASRELIASDPQWADAWSLLGAILQAAGRSAEAVAAMRHAVELQPHAGRHSQFLLAMQYVPEATPQQLLHAHCQWNAAYAQQLTSSAAPLRQSPPMQNPLRIGLISADFGQHPTGFLVLPLVEHLDKQHCQVVCYADRTAEDGLTARFRRSADLWRVTLGLTADELAEQIRTDGIDVLIDLMGHVGNRLLVFARRPAPLQLTWFGYVGTTGLTAMDGLIADRHHVRPGEEGGYVERVLRMPNGYACYGPPVDAPDVTPLPAFATGRVTFGCFNNPAKYSPGMLDAWATILGRVPHSRLLLKFGGLDQPMAGDRLRREFAARGIAAERIELAGDSPHRELLASYGSVDLALDTQPYSGGLTTCEALWMGVPVITFPGPTFAGRHSLSHLTNAGCSQFCAADIAGYVELAVDWASRTGELAALRAALREQVRNSPLCDAPRFSRDFLALLRQAASGIA